MLFGPKFYRRIEKLKNWQQQIFATAMAERMFPNFAALSDSDVKLDGKIGQIDEIIGELWLYSSNSSRFKNWYPVYKDVESCLIKVDEDSPFGFYAANNALSCVLVAISSITEHSGKESLLASDLSVKTVISYLEQIEGRTLTDEEIVENEFVQNELDCQMEISRLLGLHRSTETMNMIRKIAFNEGYSNIGIPRPEQTGKS